MATEFSTLTTVPGAERRMGEEGRNGRGKGEGRGREGGRGGKDQSSDSSVESNKPCNFPILYGVGGSAEVIFFSNSSNLTDSDSDAVSWVGSAFRRVRFFWSRWVARPSCASGAFPLGCFFGGTFAHALVVVFCDASSRPPRLRFLAFCLGAPGCLDLGAAAFLSGRGTCVF